jgi:hypothetical protein
MSLARFAKWATRPRWVWILLAVVLAAALIARVPGIRAPVLRSAGWALVFSDTLEPADIIVIAVDAGSAGALEAADLVRGGIAPRVAVFAERLDSAGREFIRRGIPHEGSAARLVRQLRELGVTAIEQIAMAVEGTEAEGEVLPRWCDQHQFRAIVVVTSPDHSRRLRRVLHRSMKNHQTKVMVRPARHSPFDPERWWETRGGVRTGISELQKLLLDVMRHPLP